MIIPAQGSAPMDERLLQYQRFRDAGADFAGGEVVTVGEGAAAWTLLLHDLGASVVHLVDPDADRVQRPDCAYAQTLEEWVEGHLPVSGVAALNISPYFAQNRRFIHTLIAAVQPQGRIVVSAHEASVMAGVTTHMSTISGVRAWHSRSVARVPLGSPHTFIKTFYMV